MKNLLSEIKNLAEDGILKADDGLNQECMKIFITIMKKAKSGLNNSPIHTVENTLQKRGYTEFNDEDKRKILIVAYCISIDSKLLYPNFNQTKAIRDAENRLNVKEDVIFGKVWQFINYREKGQNISKEMESFYNEYKEKSIERVIEEAKSILGLTSIKYQETRTIIKKTQDKDSLTNVMVSILNEFKRPMSTAELSEIITQRGLWYSPSTNLPPNTRRIRLRAWSLSRLGKVFNLSGDIVSLLEWNK